MRRKNILLVDDEELFLKSLSEGLQVPDGEFKIFTAENGRKALEVFKSGVSIDLLVTDLKMPEMDGIELLASLKHDFPATRAIVLTSLITPKIEEQLKIIGDYVLLDKSISLGSFRQRIISELRLSSRLTKSNANKGKSPAGRLAID